MSLDRYFRSRNRMIGVPSPPAVAGSVKPPSGLLVPLAGQEGLEPPTTGLEIRCSIQLSYCPIS